MKIYTYYENINHTGQDEILQLWKYSWTKAGFEAIVLGKADAQSHTFYEKFVEQIQEIHFHIMEKAIEPYGLSCYVRWLAYASQPEEKFYVSDYDCINNGLRPEEPSDKLHFMDQDCPCFASGSAKQFEKLCFNMINISINNLEQLKQIKNSIPWYNDQEFFTYNFIDRYNKKAAENLINNNMIMTRDKINDVGPYIENIQNMCKVLHVSHNNAKLIKETNTEFCSSNDLNVIRIKIIKKILFENQI